MTSLGAHPMALLGHSSRDHCYCSRLEGLVCGRPVRRRKRAKRTCLEQPSPEPASLSPAGIGVRFINSEANVRCGFMEVAVE